MSQAYNSNDEDERTKRNDVSSYVKDNVPRSLQEIEHHSGSATQEAASAPNVRVGPQAFHGARDVAISGNAKIYNAESVTNVIYNSPPPKQDEDILAKKLNPTFDAAYDSYKREGSTGCTTGTRVDLLNAIDTWVDSTNAASIYWLSGLAGTGKSTIAHSVAHKYNEVGASFFFSRDNKDRSDIKNVIKTLAYQLGVKFPILEELILKEITTNSAILNSYMQVQLQKLLLEPIRKCKHNLEINQVVLVLDALDECDHSMQKHIIDVLAQNITNYDFPMKFFITSRPEADIEYIFRTESVNLLTNPFILHNIDKEVVNADIRLYLEQEFKETPIEKHWPEVEDMNKLLEICSQLFIAASTAAKFINNGRGLDFQYKLDSIIENKYAKSSKNCIYRSLDDMYQTILQLSSGSEYWNEDMFKSTIAIIILGFSNMSLQGILQISGYSDHSDHTYAIYEMLLDLKAVLLVPPSDSKEPIHAFHLSFHDFLTNMNRCKDNKFFIKEKSHHAEIAKNCLNILTNILKINFCDVNDVSMNATDMPKSMITEAIQYAATYWMFHLEEAYPNESVEILQLVECLISNNLLQWLELTSICGQLSRALESIRLCKNVLAKILTSQCMELLNDGEQLIHQNFDTVKKYPLQIYHTGLLFTPQETLLYKRYSFHLHNVKLIQGYIKYWDPCIQVLEGHSGLVKSVAISQDGSTIVSGSHDWTVRVWNSQTGELVNELQGHSGSVNSVAISQDGSTIISGSSDWTVRVWKSQTGASVHIWSVHRPVYSVKFHENDKYVIANNGKVFMLSTGTEVDVISEFLYDHKNIFYLIIDDWILKSGKMLLWLPPDYRPSRDKAVAVTHTKVAFGTQSGRVVIISFDAEQTAEPGVEGILLGSQHTAGNDIHATNAGVDRETMAVGEGLALNNLNDDEQCNSPVLVPVVQVPAYLNEHIAVPEIPTPNFDEHVSRKKTICDGLKLFKGFFKKQNN